METTTSETARSCAMQEPTSAFLTTGLAGESQGAPGAPLVPSDNQTNKQTIMGEHKHYIMGGTQHYAIGEHNTNAYIMGGTQGTQHEHNTTLRGEHKNTASWGEHNTTSWGEHKHYIMGTQHEHNTTSWGNTNTTDH